MTTEGLPPTRVAVVRKPARRLRWRRIRLAGIIVVGVVLVLGLGGEMLFVWTSPSADHAHWDRARVELNEMSKAIVEFESTRGALPGSLAELAEYYPGNVPRDPFSREPYSYEVAGSDFWLICLGSDRAEGGAVGTERDIVATRDGLIAPVD